VHSDQIEGGTGYLWGGSSHSTANPNALPGGCIAQVHVGESISLLPADSYMCCLFKSDFDADVQSLERVQLQQLAASKLLLCQVNLATTALLYVFVLRCCRTFHGAAS